MSLHGSEMGEVRAKECSESTILIYTGEGTSAWLEEAAALEDSSWPRWSLGVGKREDWEKRTQRVTFTRGRGKKTWKKGTELLFDEEEMDRQSDLMEGILK